jgi:hypothetical protein
MNTTTKLPSIRTTLSLVSELPKETRMTNLSMTSMKTVLSLTIQSRLTYQESPDVLLLKLELSLECL